MTKWKCDKCGDVTIERQYGAREANCGPIPETGWGCKKCKPLGSGRRVKIEERKKGEKKSADHT